MGGRGGGEQGPRLARIKSKDVWSILLKRDFEQTALQSVIQKGNG